MLLKGQKQIQYDEAQRVHEIMALPEMKDKGGTAIDGGAHCGSWSTVLSEYFIEIHAFEPCKESFDLLVENMGSSEDYCFVYPHNKALMDKKCMVDVAPPRPKRRTLTARQVNYGTEVEGVTIDSLNLTECDLIKLDLEGAEPLAIAGAFKTISKFKPFLVIEFNKNIAERFKLGEKYMMQTLKNLGYEQAWQNGVDRGFACKQQ